MDAEASHRPALDGRQVEIRCDGVQEPRDPRGRSGISPRLAVRAAARAAQVQAVDVRVGDHHEDAPLVLVLRRRRRAAGGRCRARATGEQRGNQHGGQGAWVHGPLGPRRRGHEPDPRILFEGGDDRVPVRAGGERDRDDAVLRGRSDGGEAMSLRAAHAVPLRRRRARTGPAGARTPDRPALSSSMFHRCGKGRTT